MDNGETGRQTQGQTNQQTCSRQAGKQISKIDVVMQMHTASKSNNRCNVILIHPSCSGTVFEITKRWSEYLQGSWLKCIYVYICACVNMCPGCGQWPSQNTTSDVLFGKMWARSPNKARNLHLDSASGSVAAPLDPAGFKGWTRRYPSVAEWPLQMNVFTKKPCNNTPGAAMTIVWPAIATTLPLAIEVAGEVSWTLRGVIWSSCQSKLS